MEAGDAFPWACGDLAPASHRSSSVGWRGYPGAMAGTVLVDSAYPYTEPLLRAWELPHRRLMSDEDLGVIGEMAAIAGRDVEAGRSGLWIRVHSVTIERLDLSPRALAARRTDELVITTMTADLGVASAGVQSSPRFRNLSLSGWATPRISASGWLWPGRSER